MKLCFLGLNECLGEIFVRDGISLKMQGDLSSLRIAKLFVFQQNHYIFPIKIQKNFFEGIIYKQRG